MVELLYCMIPSNIFPGENHKTGNRMTFAGGHLSTNSSIKVTEFQE